MPNLLPENDGLKNSANLPAVEEILDPQNYGLYGRLFLAERDINNASFVLNPENVISIDFSAVNPNTKRNYSPIIERLSAKERADSWQKIPSNQAYKTWREKFTKAVCDTKDKDRISVLNIFTGKDPADFSESDTDVLYDKLCREKSEIAKFIDYAVSKFKEETGRTAVPHLEWLSSKLFGVETAKIVSKIIELEASLQNSPLETVEKLIISARTRRVNNLNSEEKAVLDKIYKSFDAKPTPSQKLPAKSAELAKPDKNPRKLSVSESFTPKLTSLVSEIEIEGKKITIEIGRRDHPYKGEDSFYVNSKLNTIAVFDGMGGHAAGAHASQIARDSIASVLESLPENPSKMQIEQALKDGYEKAKQEIIKQEKEDASKKGMGTTASIAFLYKLEEKLNLIILQMGDSRIFLLDNKNKLFQVSLDYSLISDDLYFGKLTKEEAEKINTKLDSVTDKKTLDDLSSYYFENRHIMTAALASNAPEPEILTKELNNDFKYVLITSDGVHDNLTNDEIASVFSESPNAQEAADKLVAFAIQRAFEPEFKNGRSKADDITAAVIKIYEKPPEKDNSVRPSKSLK